MTLNECDYQVKPRAGAAITTPHSFLPSTSARLSSATGVDAYRDIENYVQAAERDFDPERLLRIVAMADADYLSNHVDRYRSLVRSRSWPHELRPTPPSVFVNEYLQAAVAYIDVGFAALDFLDRGNNRDEILAQVQASEALRGQFGKRSTNGLDQRLDRAIEKIEGIVLNMYGANQVDAKLNLLCRPPAPWLSAEAAFLEDVSALIAQFPTPPSISDIVRAPEDKQDIAWRFLRRHAKWNVLMLPMFYRQFACPDLESWLYQTRRERAAFRDERELLITGIDARVFGSDRALLKETLEEILVLNQLNLALEPAFSFKGGPGVAHGLIFNMVSSDLSGATMTEAELTQRKWKLFSSNHLEKLRCISSTPWS